jgi:hypothetical protein
VQQVNKIEHAGPKKGRGGFYGPKRIAKYVSARRRRREDDVVARDAMVATESEPSTKNRR